MADQCAGIWYLAESKLDDVSFLRRESCGFSVAKDKYLHLRH